MTKESFSSNIGNMVLWCEKTVTLWVFFTKMGGFGTCLMKRAVFALLACSLALGAAAVGTITGAIKGQTTETGFLHGAAIGAVAGAITAVQLVALMVHGEPFSKVAFLFSLMNVKFFTEWVDSVVQRAHQWEISSLEENFGGYSDILEMNIGAKGLSKDSIKKLPQHKLVRSYQEMKCIICLEDLKEGDITRILPSCGHSFHLHCIDEWLTGHASCPICRKDI